MFNPFKFINIPVFLVALALGIFAVYIVDDGARQVVVYPTPDNLEQLQYEDTLGTCFTYQQTEVACPANLENVYRIPVQ